MSRRKSQSVKDYVTGIFVLTLLVLLAYFTIVISGVDLLRGKERTTAVITFDQVGGLKEHDSVMYRGTKVGTVEKIELTEKGLRVRVDVDKSVVLRETGRASVNSLSLLGGNYLLLEEGEGKVVDYSQTDMVGESPTDWVRDLAKISQNLNNLVSGSDIQEIVRSVRTACSNAQEVIARVQRGEGSVGRLLSSDMGVYDDLCSTLADAKQMVAGARLSLTNANETMASVKAAFDNANDVVKGVKAGEGTIGRLVSRNDHLYDELRGAIASFKTACDSFSGGEGGAGELKGIADNAKKLVASLTVVAERLERGEGTLGKLMKEDGAYNEIEGIIRDARQVLDNYRDTTPISSFSSLATGAL